MTAILEVLVVLLAARIFGRLAVACHQSSSIGEILAGVVLALALVSLPVELPLLAGLKGSEAVELIGEVGIFLLLLLTGIEMEPKEIAEHSREAVLVACGGMLLPLALGCLLGWAVLPPSDLKQGQVLIIGIGLSISAIPVAAKVFMELGLLHQAVGEIVIAAAVIDDILGLVLLAIASHLIIQGDLPDLAALLLLLGAVGVFFGVAIGLGLHVYGPLWRWLHVHHGEAMSLSALLLFALGLGALAELLGLHFVLGPFVAGLFFETGRVGVEAYERVKAVVGTVTSAVAAPVFFAWIGLQLDLDAFTTVPEFLAALIALAFLGKLIGAGLPAYLCGLGPRHALAIGIGLSGRGAVELVIASIAQKSGLFLAGDGAHPIVGNLFSALVITAVATTLVVPIGLRCLLGWRRRPP
ncbi:MAG: cation:proton antiporter [Kiloniellales bacterium]|nr:cation:proton antiporter [Kiloniellales bacterium]